MGTIKRLIVKFFWVIFPVVICFNSTPSSANMAFVLTDKNDSSRAAVDIKANKAYLTVVEMKNGKWSSKKVAVEEYCKKEVGIVVTDIQGINLKTGSKLCRCVTTNNLFVFIVRYKDGEIKILRDNEGNYNIQKELTDKNKKISGIQYVSAKETPDGRLELLK